MSLRLRLFAAVAAAIGFVSVAWAQQRVKPPTFQPSDYADVFFSDVFKEGVVGARPANLDAPPAAAPAGSGSPSADPGASSGGGKYAWAKLVPASVLEDEIKRITLALEPEIATPSKFNGPGHRLARQSFSVLSLLFDVIADYDGEVRFKDKARGASAIFARSAGNMKVASQGSFNEAKLRLTELQDLLNGSGEFPTPPDEPWVYDVAPLMQRLETAFDQKLRPSLASESEFTSATDEIAHQAAIVAVIAEAMTHEGMENAGDEEYDGMSKTLRDASVGIQEAVKLMNYDQASKAVGVIDNVCTTCHETYRSQ